jgi:hypothetical protein
MEDKNEANLNEISEVIFETTDTDGTNVASSIH